MRIALVCVGDELLLGDVVDTNAALVGRRLAAEGMPLCWSATASDDVEAIVATVRDALERAEVVVVSGGLGPTSDDVTRAALAELAGVPLERDAATQDHVVSAYRARGLDPSELSLAQADVPQGAEVLTNRLGTAPGLRVAVPGGSLVVALPGVPSELEALLDEQVVPHLVQRHAGTTAFSLRTVRVALLGESPVAEAVAPLSPWLTEAGVRLAFLASAGEVLVRLSASAPQPEQARRVVDDATARVAARLGGVVSGFDGETLPATVVRLLRETGASVATAESLTGGCLGAALTSVPGSSAVFLGGSVTYSTAAKVAQLGVDEQLLAEHGPVHPDVAAQMALGARRGWGSDWALSCTGVAGPGPADGVAAGTVHVGLCGPGATTVRSLRLRGARETVRAVTVIHALDLLRRAVLGLPTSG